MLVPFGLHSFRNEVLACRPDFCAACDEEGVSIQVRGFQWFSLFGIPLVPLGRRSQWLCRSCGRPPQAIFRLSVALLALAGFGLSAYATLMMFTGDSTGESVYYVWEGRLLFGAFTLFMAVLALKYLPTPNRRARLRHLRPASRETCLLCGGPLDRATPQRCQGCGVIRGVIEA